MNPDTSGYCDTMGEDNIHVRLSIIDTFAGSWCMMLVQSFYPVELGAPSLGAVGGHSPSKAGMKVTY